MCWWEEKAAQGRVGTDRQVRERSRKKGPAVEHGLFDV